jgi:hypothetical protein
LARGGYLGEKQVITHTILFLISASIDASFLASLFVRPASTKAQFIEAVEAFNRAGDHDDEVALNRVLDLWHRMPDGTGIQLTPNGLVWREAHSA